MTTIPPQCQVACPGGGMTTLTGKVFAPNGTLPLYNAIVYVPSQQTLPLTNGASCEPCGAKVSGSPIVAALTDASGSFRLTNVPVGDKIPLVVQLGKWRRQVTVSVPPCTTAVVDVNSTRLPKNKNEGDMPQMAIATGGADPFECLLLKMGIDVAEMTPSGGGGRVTFLLGDDGPGLSMPNAQKAHTVTGTPSALRANDILILPCEGLAFPKGDAPNLVDYLNMGGRVFATHFNHEWLTWANSPYLAVGAWNVHMDDLLDPYPGIIDQSFPKGVAFAQWLHNVSPAINGQFDILDHHNDLDSVNAMYGQRWIYHVHDYKVQHMTFNTPLNPPLGPDHQPQYCGRAVYSDFHVTTDARSTVDGMDFPNACGGYPNLLPMTDQEKALTFMLFDLSSCVQPDSALPVPPIG